MIIRIGMGFDTHQLKEGHSFWLGGLNIPCKKGAVGHSDADVLIHAICDALLGAANMGDIGTHFDDKDMRWKDMQSSFFLKEIVSMIAKKGWKIGNIDSTVCLEFPKLKPHIVAIRQELARIMCISDHDISVKATTNEGMGYIGREEGVSAHAVALITRAPST